MKAYNNFFQLMNLDAYVVNTSYYDFVGKSRWINWLRLIRKLLVNIYIIYIVINITATSSVKSWSFVQNCK